jgi:hypothetical protein
MQAEYYTDRSIAVIGETKPWAVNLRGLGGKFNGNLRGRPGWIFPKSKETELMQFIGQANAGVIIPAVQPVQYPTAQVQIAPFGATQPALSPQTAMSRLNINQQFTPMPTPTIPMPMQYPQVAIPMPQISTPQLVPRPISPKPIIALPVQPLTIGFPNMFEAADGLTYQIIMYTVPVPRIGQRVTLTVGEAIFDYVVSSIQKTTSPIDDILISQVLPDDTEPDREPSISRAIIMNGQWKIHCMQDEHTLTFLPIQ